jgi:hypothetical protein
MTEARAKALARIDAEHEAFKRDMLGKTKEQVYNEHYSINFYTAMSDFFENAELDDDTYEALLKSIEDGGCDGVLDGLWERFIKWEYVSINTYESIEEFIAEYVVWLGGRQEAM